MLHFLQSIPPYVWVIAYLAVGVVFTCIAAVFSEEVRELVDTDDGDCILCLLPVAFWPMILIVMLMAGFGRLTQLLILAGVCLTEYFASLIRPIRCGVCHSIARGDFCSKCGSRVTPHR